MIYDGVGEAAFLKSLDCIRPMGMVISYGTASGNVGAFDLQLLHRKSIIVTRPTLRTWIATRSDYEAAAAAFFDAVISGKIRAEVNRSYALHMGLPIHPTGDPRRHLWLGRAQPLSLVWPS